MNNQNLSTIAGRLGKNPVVYMRNTKKGQLPVAKFSLAVDTLQEGKKVTVWFQVSAWQKRAELVSKHLQKGDAVQLIGHSTKEKYINKKGETVEGWAFDAIWITFLGKAKGNTEQTAVQAAVQTQPQVPVQTTLPGLVVGNNYPF